MTVQREKKRLGGGGHGTSVSELLMCKWPNEEEAG